ncbi:DUF222 domain-containing protein [Actinopolymorpha sp. B11F2]|uniref:DUF222 domain-containing protein n=1 Tax=Actinopolymorpha sp. B11F2 TaxID=3160862 RepID=UPI0032E3B578
MTITQRNKGKGHDPLGLERVLDHGGGGLARHDARRVGVRSDRVSRAASSRFRPTVEKIARAGRYLRQVLDPDGHHDDEKAHRRRFMTAHREPDGGISGSYYLRPEAAARLQTLFDTYGRKQGADDTRTTSIRNADVLIQLLVQAVTAELLVLVNAETLTDDGEEHQDTESGDTDTGDTDSRQTRRRRN